jgi:hypothetical protein
MRQRTRRIVSVVAPALFLILAVPGLARAQRATETGLGLPRFYGGGGVLGAQPQGEFADFVDAGFGVGGHALLRLDERGLFGIRLDGGFLNYGSETKRVPLSGTIGGRIRVDVNTTNNIFFLGAGPQLLLPTGSFRPYVNGNVGFSVFATTSSVEGVDSAQPFASDDNYSDATLSYGGGAGFYIPVYRGKNTVSLDIGARYHSNGRVKYLREGSIVDLPNGDIEITPIRSRADLITYHLGVSVSAR